MKADHIHELSDRRGPRNVYCDGKLIEKCVYADTELGLVKYVDEPAQVNEARDGFVVHEMYGVVTIEFLYGGLNG